MLDKSMLVADAVTKYPKTADVFRKYGIDFCCGGKISIEEAVHNHKRVDLSTIMNKLEAVSEDKQDGIQASDLNVRSLVQYIQTHFHEPLKEEFKQLTPYVTKLARVHGSNHPNLLELKDVYDAFKEAMLTHTDEEDHVSFPKLVAYSEGESVADINETIQSLVDDHTNAGLKLVEMRKLTGGFVPPLEACGTWRLVYNRLQTLEKDTHEHVHLENHVLFEKVNQL
ncbi:iron-sulfur cluster repair di-iron protein ScdA [Staphylococcus massiliensis]|uniref:iron-sulfur cluster repair di-iron protein ScdA n=1 Tax=Staphylococcus massiliensis TaxID=555791 RepID=UPI001EDDBD60|nr:iron-sulfur cluster repair di-iron protein ScdA [Staphylococcus massiliensis]MCG3402292.1 iron-sulfur cluster repair di-iron protein ScdA [Staphylococcus massiliensis]